MESHNQNKENIDEFRIFISQQKPTNTKIKTQSDLKTWKRFCLTENENREVSNIPEQELNLPLWKFLKNI